jgi:hypothetical protein
MTTATILFLAKKDVAIGDITGSNALQNNFSLTMAYKFGELVYNYAQSTYPEETEIVKEKVSEGVEEVKDYFLKDLEGSVRVQKSDQKTFESLFHKSNQILQDPSLPWWMAISMQHTRYNQLEAMGKTDFYPTNRLDYGLMGLDLATLGSGTGLFGRAASMTKNFGKVAYLGNKVRQTAKIPFKQFGQNTFQTMMPHTNIGNMGTLGLGYANTGGETITKFGIEGEKVLSQVSKTIGEKIDTFSKDLVKNHKFLQGQGEPLPISNPFLIAERTYEQKAINLNKGSSNISNTSQLLTKSNPSTAPPSSYSNIYALDLSFGKATLSLNAPKMVDHHIFPQQFRKFFEQKGINIDKFTVTVGKTTHLKGLHGKGNAGLPGKWNKRWLTFIEENPNASTSEIYQFGGKLMDEYKLNNLHLHEYKK